MSRRTRDRLMVGTSSALVVLLSLGLLQLLPWGSSDWRTVLVIGCLGLLAGYAIHRYVQVQLRPLVGEQP